MRNQNIETLLKNLEDNYQRVKIIEKGQDHIKLKVFEAVFNVDIEDLDLLLNLLDHYIDDSEITIKLDYTSIYFKDKVIFFTQLEEKYRQALYFTLGYDIVKEDFDCSFKGKKYSVEIGNLREFDLKEDQFEQFIDEIEKEGIDIDPHISGLLINLISGRDNPIQYYIKISSDQGKKKDLWDTREITNLVYFIIFEFYRNQWIMLRLVDPYNISESFIDYRSYNISKKPVKPIEVGIYRYIDPFLLDMIYEGDITPNPFFKYLSYYRVFEYFYDKSPMGKVFKDIRRIIIKPEFASDLEGYTKKIYEIVRNNISSISEVDKLKDLLSEFIEPNILDKIDNEIAEHIKKRIILDGGLELPSIMNKGTVNWKTCANRIYDLRRAIVHSNPSYWKKNKKPIHYTNKNFEYVWTESNFLRILSVELIGKASLDFYKSLTGNL